MLALVVSLALAAPDEVVGVGALREVVGEVAIAQVRRIDPTWQPQQRDCAGLCATPTAAPTSGCVRRG